jgi:hypothetical protein
LQGDYFMAVIIRRNWYLAALTLATVAIAMQLLGQHFAGLGMMTMARSAQALHDSKRYAYNGRHALASAEASESGRLKQVARRYARLADLWGGASLGLALLTAAYWASACLHREAGDHKILVALLAVYLLLLLLVV